MIDAFQRSGRLVQFLSVRPQFNAHHVVDRRARGRPVGRRHQRVGRSDQRRVLRLPPRPARRDRARRRARRRDVRAADRARRAGRVPLRGILGADGHDQGSSSGSRPARERQRSVAHVGSADRARAPGVLMHSLTLGCSPPIRRVLAIGCHADDIEIGCGATLLALTARRSRTRGDVGRARRRRASAREEARASADAFLASAARRRDRRPWVPGRLLSVPRRRGQGGVRGAEGGSSPISFSRTRGTTSTRITASRASSRGTRSATTSCSSTRSRSTTATSGRRTSIVPVCADDARTQGRPAPRGVSDPDRRSTGSTVRSSLA